MISKKLQHIVIELVHGDITGVSADIIVNAANNELWMGSGVAGAIKIKGGREIETEAMSKGPVEPGQAVETGAGKLPYRHVIHAAVMGRDTSPDSVIIEEAVSNSLKLAEKLQCSSIVFPALGTGVGGFSLEKCAEIMTEEVKAFDRAAPLHVKKVIFALFSQKAFDVFEAMYRKIS
ncbi:MAG TPA: macro domain-containing protein [Candidatus Goldiibacteriota bacterium]|nr:macro domain-containing protein [Candidatus Goldiibacteriota bacterium]HPN63766.1 macro domain-containing protein [Candidatus Goldiibacteriota bacterium]HRQ43450.1 macro domain-containing protein [Candidatus Goldiibacteriota bacterium]